MHRFARERVGEYARTFARQAETWAYDEGTSLADLWERAGPGGYENDLSPLILASGKSPEEAQAIMRAPRERNPYRVTLERPICVGLLPAEDRGEFWSGARTRTRCAQLDRIYESSFIISVSSICCVTVLRHASG